MYPESGTYPSGLNQGSSIPSLNLGGTLNTMPGGTSTTMPTTGTGRTATTPGSTMTTMPSSSSMQGGTTTMPKMSSMPSGSMTMPGMSTMPGSTSTTMPTTGTGRTATTPGSTMTTMPGSSPMQGGTMTMPGNTSTTMPSTSSMPSGTATSIPGGMPTVTPGLSATPGSGATPNIGITPPNFDVFMAAAAANTATTSTCSDNNGVMPSCAPLAVPYVPFQQSGGKRYNHSEALNNGTLFPALNLPFHLKVKGSDVVTNALAELQAVGFVMHELALYLDTHPDDKEAFTMFQQYAAMEKEGRERYEKAYGPISRPSSANGTEYTWINNPWPWDYQEGK